MSTNPGRQRYSNPFLSRLQDSHEVGTDEQPGSFSSAPPVRRVSSPPAASTLSNPSLVAFDGETSLSKAGQNIYNIQHSTIMSLSDTLQPSSAPVPASVHQEGVTLSDTSEHPSRTYARLQNRHGLGYALYRPQPISSLPAQCRERGVSIGDVGIITSEGAFDTLFNIYLPSDDPINLERAPPSFVPIFPGRLPTETIDSDRDAWQAGDIRHAGSVWERPLPGTFADNHELWFEGSASEGAILVLPCGGSRHNLLSTNDVFKYINDHAEEWYEHINNIRASGGLGRDATNGSLYVVTGVDKTRCWGTGAFSGVVGGGKFMLSFRETTPVSRFSHAWDPSSIAALRHGPAREQHGAESATENPENQCIFLRGYKIALSEWSWKLLFTTRRLQITSEPQISSRSDHVTSVVQKSSTSWIAQWALGASPSSIQHGSGSQRTQDNKSPEDRPIISRIEPPLLTVHPSDIINSYLLEQDKSARMAVTHDSVWCSAILDIKEDNTSLRDRDLLKTIISKNTIVRTDDIVHFGRELQPSQIKPTLPASTPPPSTSLSCKKVDQVAFRFYTKLFNIVNHGRTIGTQPSKVDKWFNLEVPDSSEFGDVFGEPYRTVSSTPPPPLRIQVLLTVPALEGNQKLVCDAASPSRRRVNPLPDYILLEEYVLSFRPGLAESEISPPTLYKHGISLFRSLFTLLRLLPASKLCKHLEAYVGTEDYLGITTRICAVDDPRTLSFIRSYGTDMHTFPSVQHPTGSLALNVTYLTEVDFRIFEVGPRPATKSDDLQDPQTARDLSPVPSLDYPSPLSLPSLTASDTAVGEKLKEMNQVFSRDVQSRGIRPLPEVKSTEAGMESFKQMEIVTEMHEVEETAEMLDLLSL